MGIYTLNKVRYHAVHQYGRFVAIVAIAAVLLGASFGVQSAYAADFQFRVPPYANHWGDPLQTCETVLNTKFCSWADKSNGVARVYAKDDAPLGWNLVRAEHNVNPPTSNPQMVIDQYRNIYYNSLLKGKFRIDTSDPAEGGEMRYGGITAFFRPSDSKWVKSYQWFVKKSLGPTDTPTTYTIPNTNVVFVKGEQAGKYSVGSQFIATTTGDFSLGTAGIVDAYTTSLGYGFTSLQVSMEWCDSGTCPY